MDPKISEQTLSPAQDEAAQPSAASFRAMIEDLGSPLSDEFDDVLWAENYRAEVAIDRALKLVSAAPSDLEQARQALAQANPSAVSEDFFFQLSTGGVSRRQSSIMIALIGELEADELTVSPATVRYCSSESSLSSGLIEDLFEVAPGRVRNLLAATATDSGLASETRIDAIRSLSTLRSRIEEMGVAEETLSALYPLLLDPNEKIRDTSLDTIASFELLSTEHPDYLTRAATAEALDPALRRRAESLLSMRALRMLGGASPDYQGALETLSGLNPAEASLALLREGYFPHAYTTHSPERVLTLVERLNGGPDSIDRECMEACFERLSPRKARDIELLRRVVRINPKLSSSVLGEPLRNREISLYDKELPLNLITTLGSDLQKAGCSTSVINAVWNLYTAEGPWAEQDAALEALCKLAGDIPFASKLLQRIALDESQAPGNRIEALQGYLATWPAGEKAVEVLCGVIEGGPGKGDFSQSARALRNAWWTIAPVLAASIPGFSFNVEDSELYPSEHTHALKSAALVRLATLAPRKALAYAEKALDDKNGAYQGVATTVQEISHSVLLDRAA